MMMTIGVVLLLEGIDLAGVGCLNRVAVAWRIYDSTWAHLFIFDLVVIHHANHIFAALLAGRQWGPIMF